MGDWGEDGWERQKLRRRDETVRQRWVTEERGRGRLGETETGEERGDGEGEMGAKERRKEDTDRGEERRR